VVMIHQRHRRTDGQTDDMRSQDRALHYSASRGNKRILGLYSAIMRVIDVSNEFICNVFHWFESSGQLLWTELLHSGTL